jgi:hypothetical protein
MEYDDDNDDKYLKVMYYFGELTDGGKLILK